VALLVNPTDATNTETALPFAAAGGLMSYGASQTDADTSPPRRKNGAPYGRQASSVSSRAGNRSSFIICPFQSWTASFGLCTPQYRRTPVGVDPRDITAANGCYKATWMLGPPLWLGAMRCKACDAEMTLMKVVKVDPTRLLGFERHTFTCWECHDVKWNLIFIRHGRETDSEPLPVHRAPPIVPTSVVQDERNAARGLFTRVLAKMRSR